LLEPQEVRFLRKEIGMKSKALAEALSMKPETYSRWENGKQEIAACHDKTLRMIYVMHASEKYGKVLFQDSQYILKELAIRKAPKKSKKIQFTPSEWITRLIDEPIFGGEVCVA
jgi:transcriptional regulator with XRE-family HTH domain